MVGRIVLVASINYWKATHPEPPPPPTVGFGILPPINFPEQTAEDKPSSYTQEMASSKIPEFSDRAEVFFMPRSTVSLLADDEAKEIASKLGYSSTPETINNRIYRWSKSKPINSSLEMDIFNHTFTITSDFLTRPELIIDAEIPTDFEVVQQVKSFLSSADLLPEDVVNTSGKVELLVSLGGQIGDAVSLSDADYVRVNLMRARIDSQLPLYTPEGERGIINAIIAGNLKGKDAIVQMNYHYHPVEYYQVHTYPIRSADSAWQILQAGEGYVVNKGDGETAVVREVALGYYDDYEEQDYLQPIYVFTGDNDFMAFVSAVDPKFIQVMGGE